MKQNSRFYSAKKSPRLLSSSLPHVTIQCPVYKEGLAATIAPTIQSIKAAISTYELQGGSANMFVNDDGLQIIGEEEREQRVEFYKDNGIGWTARPKMGSMVNGKPFERRGKFKKVCMHWFRHTHHGVCPLPPRVQGPHSQLRTDAFLNNCDHSSTLVHHTGLRRSSSTPRSQDIPVSMTALC